jgi:holo-[acyl-carrier protein] synthase
MITGIGCDIVAIGRFKTNTLQLAMKVLTPQERKLYEALSEIRKPEWLAGRFAAKEAIVKAIGQGLTLSQISVLADAQGKPVCELEGYSVLVSISHEAEYAIAYAIVQTTELA